MTGSLSVMACAILKSFTALVSDIGDELEVIGTCSLGGVDVGVGDAEVLDADEDCSTCCTGGGGAGRGGRGLSQGCLNASVDVIRFLPQMKNSRNSKNNDITKEGYPIPCKVILL